jgi:hypothetical protein
MDFKLRTPNSELNTIFRRKSALDEILVQLTVDGLPCVPKKVLVRGERAGEISSYVAGWMAGKGMDVIVLDGANRFDPYMVSTFARKALIPPERLLKRIRIARAFTCYQMATLMGERLISLVGAIRACTPECGLPSPKRFVQAGVSARRHESPLQKPWVILLGPITTFLDEDVPEREVRPLFERSLKKIDEMTKERISFLFFQSLGFNPPFPPFTKGGRRRPEPGLLRRSSVGCEGWNYGVGRLGGLMSSKRAYLMRRLFQFSNLVWRICLEGGGPQVVLEKGLTFTKSLSHSVIGHSMT